MIPLSESSLRVQYDLRPAKQAERRMFMDALQLLSMHGYPIRDYQYTGMGAIYFVDFILFHKLLGIQEMLSVEVSPKIQKRVKFNQPYGCVNLKRGPIGNFIPYLSSDLKHILWLDYDNVLCGEYLQDIAQAATILSAQSLLIITVDAGPPGDKSEKEWGPRKWQLYFEEEAQDYLSLPADPTIFELEQLPQLYVDLIIKAIKTGLRGRSDVEFIPLFNFTYADGASMLTIGGMIGKAQDRRKIRQSRLAKTIYYRDDFKRRPYEIKVPKLTRKERLHLDSLMPSSKKWDSKVFQQEDKDVQAYREIYRFLPAYAELLL